MARRGDNAGSLCGVVMDLIVQVSLDATQRGYESNTYLLVMMVNGREKKDIMRPYRSARKAVASGMEY